MLKRLILTAAISFAALPSAWAEDKLPVTQKTCTELLAFYKNSAADQCSAAARGTGFDPWKIGGHHDRLFADRFQSSLARRDAGGSSGRGLPSSEHQARRG